MKYTVVGHYPSLDSNGYFVDHKEAETVDKAIAQCRIDRMDEHVDIVAVFEGHLMDLNVGG
jgi:hypothetical protein